MNVMSKKIIKMLCYVLPLSIIIYLLHGQYSRYLYEIVPAWVIVLLFWLSCTLTGMRMNSWLKLTEKISLRLSLYFFLGSSIVLLILLVLLFTWLFYSWLLVVLTFLGIMLNAKYIKELIGALKVSGGGKIFLIMVSVQILIILCAGSSPPIFYDGLIYQLVIPANYLQHHGFTYNPFSTYTSFPANMNLFFAIPLSFNSDIGAQLLSFLFALMIFVALKEFISANVENNSGTFCALIFLTTPVVALTSLLPAVDLALAFYALLSFLLLFQYIKEENKTLLIFSGIAAGIALGIKYLYMMYLVPISFLALIIFPQNWSAGKKTSRFVYFNALALLVFSPWAIKNLIIHKDPIYPMLSHVGTSRVEVLNIFFGEKTLPAILFSIKDYLLFPIDMNFKTLGAAGIMGCFFIVMIPWIIFCEKRSHHLFKFSLMVSIVGIILFTLTPHSLRYFLIVVPFLCIMYGMALSEAANLFQKAGRIVAYLCIALNIIIGLNQVTTLGLFSYATLHSDRSSFLSRFVEYYDVAEYLNKNAPLSSRVLMIGEARTFYIKQECYYNFYLQPIVLEQWIKESATLDNFLALLKKKNVQYVLFNYLEMNNIVKKLNKDEYFSLPPHYRNILDSFISTHLTPVYQNQFVTLYKVIE